MKWIAALVALCSVPRVVSGLGFRSVGTFDEPPKKRAHDVGMMPEAIRENARAA